MSAMPEVSPEPLLQLMSGLQATAVLRAAIQLQVFDQLGAGGAEAATVAKAVGADERGTRILLDALAALGLIQRNGAEYRNTPLTETYLDTSKPTYLGGTVELLAGHVAWEGYPRLAEAVRAGGTLMTEHAETPSNQWWETFATASTGIAAPAAHELVGVVGDWVGGLSEPRVLDVACGSGLFSLILATQVPGVRPTLADWPNVLEKSKLNVERMGLADRTSYRPGDLFEGDLGGPYDLVVASHIFHHFDVDASQALMNRLAEVVRPGGRIVVHDFVTGPEPAQAPFPYLFSVVMLIWSRNGESHSLDTYTRMLSEAGFSAPVEHGSHAIPGTFLVAEKLG